MSKFDWKIYLKKGLKKIALAAGLGICAEVIVYLGTEPVPTEYVWITSFGIVIFEMIMNGIKHAK